MKKIGLISLSLILILVVVAVISCSGNKKAPASSKGTQEATVKVTESEEKLEEDSTNQTESSSVDETSDNSTEDTSTETTTVPTTKEETTTKPVVKEEETTKKANKQTSSKKENQTTSAKEQTTTKPKVNANQFTYEIWDEAVTYKFSDDINEQINVYDLPSKDSEVGGWYSKGGMTVEITGICKENGWYRIKHFDGIGYVSNEYKVIKKASIDDPFDSYASMEDYIEGLYIENYYTGKMYLTFPGDSSVSGKDVDIYYNSKIEDLLYIYSYIMPRYAVHYYDPEEGFDGTETVEELIKNTFGDNSIWTVQHYKNGEALAKYYGLDFHSDVEVLKSWGLVDYDKLEYEEMRQIVYCTGDVTFNSYIKEKPHETARFFLQDEIDKYGGFSTIGGHFYITKKYIDYPWYEILYIGSEAYSNDDRVIVAYIRVEDFERYYQEGAFVFER